MQSEWDRHRKDNLIETNKTPEHLQLPTCIQIENFRIRLFLWVKKAIPAQSWTGPPGS